MRKYPKSYILNPKSGFTLIELLVVIAIISVLATLLMANFVGIRQRGRDAQRKSDLRQIQVALELYRADNGNYPTTFPACGAKFETPGAVYMQKIPCDPLTKTDYAYVPVPIGCSTDCTGYTIYACLENQNDSDRDTGTGGSPPPQSSCTTAGFASFTLTNP